MKSGSIILIIICSLYVSSAWAQPYFRDSLDKANPAPADSKLSLEQKLKTHQYFLDTAKYLRHQLYGHLYLFVDYIRLNDYTNATAHILEAETLAKATGNSGWQGAVHHRKGILNVYLKKYADAIPEYEAAVRFCSEARDSLCIAEGLEQLSSMYGRTGNYQQAQRYFQLAMPLLKRYGGDIQMCTALNNFGNLLALQERPAEAIPYFEHAVVIAEKMQDAQRQTQFLNNLADSYGQLHLYKKALQTYDRCIRINEQHDWSEGLIFNYQGISVIYEQAGNMDSALVFYKKYHILRDSILSAETQQKVAALQIQFDSQQKEMALQKSQVDLDAARQSLERGAVVFFLIVLCVFLGLWRWRTQIQQASKERHENQDNLQNMTRLLLEKNTLLAAQEAQINANASEPIAESADFEYNLYNQRILTPGDWAAFKTYFEKVYPGYILRLNAAYPALSDAEKRLFLFIKLNLDRRESAAILGVSVDTVKKTRSRLRKRLVLAEEDDLERYIHAF